jgi:LacI family transcriptional regulator
MNDKNLTIYDIAKELGVSGATVSRALSGNKGVSSQTRNRVVKKAKELRFTPNKIAKSLRDGRSNTIGVIVPKIQTHFFSGILEGIEFVLNTRGYTLLICQSGESTLQEAKQIDVLLNNQVAGIMISVSKDLSNYDHLKKVTLCGTPLVQFDRIVTELATDCVINGNEIGALNAVRHLIENGYQRIVHLAGPQQIKLFEDRFSGYKKALFEVGFPFKEDLVVPALTEQEGYNEVKKLLQSKIKFDAIFSCSDFAALGALKALREGGVDVPNEVGVVGYSNETWTELIQPSLTTLEQFPIEIGKGAGQLIIDEIEMQSSVIPRSMKTVSINPQLIVRGTSVMAKENLIIKKTGT